MSGVTFALLGEPLVLDLINTRPNAAAGPVDLLANPAALRDWLAAQQHRLTTTATPAPTPTDLAAVVAVREHAAVALDHARRELAPPEAALAGLTQALRAAPSWRELTATGAAGVTGNTGGTGAAEPAGATVTARVRREGPLGIRLAAELADAATDLLTDPAAVSAVRTCEAPDCVLLFLTAHPRRRWCSAARCGNRTRVRRYYHRHRGM